MGCHKMDKVMARPPECIQATLRTGNRTFIWSGLTFIDSVIFEGLVPETITLICWIHVMFTSK